jgi:hypothetical protein
MLEIHSNVGIIQCSPIQETAGRFATGAEPPVSYYGPVGDAVGLLWFFEHRVTTLVVHNPSRLCKLNIILFSSGVQ